MTGTITETVALMQVQNVDTIGLFPQALLYCSNGPDWPVIAIVPDPWSSMFC